MLCRSREPKNPILLLCCDGARVEGKVSGEEGIERKSTMDDESKRMVEWSNLPQELWLEIFKYVKSAIDVVRLRSICRLWRSLLPLPSSYAHCIPHHGYHCLLQTKTYRLEPLHHSSKEKGWIVKVIGESKLCLLNPFLLKFTFLKPNKLVLNMMDFRVVELFEEYTFKLLRRENYVEYNHRKVVLFESRIVFVLRTNEKLYVSEIGDKNWIENDVYDDIIVHKGNIYAVDKRGTIWWIKINRSSILSFEFVQFSPTMNDTHGERKHLVECDGSLYVVDTLWRNHIYHNNFDIEDVKVYKLEEELGRWLNVKDLGDILFVLGEDSNFSLSARDYYGCQGNCIYFATKYQVCGFSLDSSRINQSPRIFWRCSNFKLQLGA